MTTGAKNTVNIENYLIEKKLLLDNHLKELFNKDIYSSPSSLWDAVRYSVLCGGKRIRGALCIATFEAFETDSRYVLNDCLMVASALELTHAMSLVHDDLPAMDNDDLRRGKPSCHKAFGEAYAILAGDTMISLPFYLITECCKNISSEQKLKLLKLFSEVMTFGLFPGQAYDLSILNEKCDLKYLEDIYKLKTAALIKASVTSGAILAGRFYDNSSNVISRLERFGQKIGLGFQIVDDILDVTQDTKTLGKTSGKDAKYNKPVFPSVVGLEKSKIIAEELMNEAKEELKSLPLNKSVLCSIADYIVSRIN